MDLKGLEPFKSMVGAAVARPPRRLRLVLSAPIGMTFERRRRAQWRAVVSWTQRIFEILYNDMQVTRGRLTVCGIIIY